MAPMPTSVAEVAEVASGERGQRAPAHSTLVYYLPDLPKGD
jgi:hypothetical protein